MEAPAPPYLHLLVRQDFSRTCAKVRYCFTCSGAFCQDCCPLHAARHHPEHPHCRIAQMKVVRGVVCVREEDVAGIGYDWRIIQKFKDGGSRFIPLKRNIVQGWLPINCKMCNDRMYLRSSHCSTGCRLQYSRKGGGRDAVAALVGTPFHQQHRMDRFCTVCCRLFASSCCTDHVATHHPGQMGTAVRLVRQNGSILTPAVDLVGFTPHTLEGIQTIIVNGIAMVAICRSKDHPELEGEPGNLCGYCFKLIGLDCSYCCLQCGADDNWNL